MSDSIPLPWLEVTRGDAPLVVSLPHTGTEIPAGCERGLVSLWLARKDADWWIDRLYDFAGDLGATIIRTAISRTVIDVNRDPSGISLYPGQATTELCPTTTFDGEPLYLSGAEPDAASVAERRTRFFEPYHAALQNEVDRLRASHPRVVVYDCHSIRSAIPRLFDGTLPNFNIGTNGGATCAAALSDAVEQICAASNFSHVLNGRFKGGFITRTLGRPENGVHAVQMELACRGYMMERAGPVAEGRWPTAYDDAYAAPMRAVLTRILEECLNFAQPGFRGRTTS
ncbi:N-formylglutamate deformylase [Microvirga brassicacearum]|uniref:N-formylglutamate deformylase n=1 Tax=Microvirga brassicacearum TaxID=2580413 RepID=A0A5N3PDC5_9HYPH|nr:N-formylglutamate deformylase [Microvirga brassicacearum]KAB0267711.1 N-formylglutamate deformylase [Microvirga brassicacearum]